MGVSSTTNRVAYSGDGSTQTFAFAFYFFDPTDMLVFIYDTLTGGITEFILNTDYTISGTPNSQGLYPSGANIILSSYTPVSTDRIVIVRDPPEEQDYSLLPNQNISSLALVQQLDYVTLLIQRLQDKVGRAILLPDGLGSVFDTTLPDTIAVQPGSFPQVNDTGDGLVLSNTSMWQKKVISYTDLQTGSTSNTAAILSLPPGAVLTGLFIKHATAFAGTLITDVVANIGIASDHARFIENFDILQSVSDTAFDNVILNYLNSWASSTNIVLQAISTGANLSALTAGSVTVYYAYQYVQSV